MCSPVHLPTGRGLIRPKSACELRNLGSSKFARNSASSPVASFQQGLSRSKSPFQRPALNVVARDFSPSNHAAYVASSQSFNHTHQGQFEMWKHGSNADGLPDRKLRRGNCVSGSETDAVCSDGSTPFSGTAGNQSIPQLWAPPIRNHHAEIREGGRDYQPAIRSRKVTSDLPTPDSSSGSPCLGNTPQSYPSSITSRTATPEPALTRLSFPPTNGLAPEAHSFIPAAYTQAPETTHSRLPLLGLSIKTDLTDENLLAVHRSEKGRPTTPAGSERSLVSASSLSGSEALGSEQLSPEDPFLIQLIAISATALVRKYISSLQHIKQCAPSQSAAATGSTPTSRATQSRDRGSPFNKRKTRSSGDGDEDEDENAHSKRGKHLSRGSSSATLENSILLACPFNKFNSYLFSPYSPGDDYSACAKFCSTHIAHLKQHLQRNHYLPDYFCFRCCKDCKNQGNFAVHQRQQPICQLRRPPVSCERIGADLREQLDLDRKNSNGTNKIEYWFKVYEAFFPGDAEKRRINPRYEGPNAEQLHSLARFAEQEMPRLLPHVRARFTPSQGSSESFELQLQQEIQQEALRRFSDFVSATPMPHLPNLGFEAEDMEDAREVDDVKSLNEHREQQNSSTFLRNISVPRIIIDGNLAQEGLWDNLARRVPIDYLPSNQAATATLPFPSQNSIINTFETPVEFPSLGIRNTNAPTLVTSEGSASVMELCTPLHSDHPQDSSFDVFGGEGFSTIYDNPDEFMSNLGTLDWERELQELGHKDPDRDMDVLSSQDIPEAHDNSVDPNQW